MFAHDGGPCLDVTLMHACVGTIYYPAGNFFGPIHTTAIFSIIWRTKASKLNPECLCNGEGQDVGIRHRDSDKSHKEPQLSKISRVWRVRALANESRYVVCGACTRSQQSSCRLQREARLASHSVARCTCG